MEKYIVERTIVFLVFVASVFLFSGCGTQTKPQTPSSPTEAQPTLVNPSVNVTTQPQATAEIKTNNLDNCANRYYPVSPNSTWTYTGKNSVSGAYRFTRILSKITADGFEDSDTWDSGIKRTGSWACSQGTLTALYQGGVATVIECRQQIVLRNWKPNL